MDNNDVVYVKLDEINWTVRLSPALGRTPIPLCPKHNLRLTPIGSPIALAMELKCDDCDHRYKIPRALEDEEAYVLNKIDSRQFKQMKPLNLDDEAVPLAKEKIAASAESPYWVEARLFNLKTGPTLVIYAGDKRREGKTQVFVEPGARRVGFDRADSHPFEIFLKVEAIFDSGDKSTMSKMDREVTDIAERAKGRGTG